VSISENIRRRRKNSIKNLWYSLASILILISLVMAFGVTPTNRKSGSTQEGRLIKTIQLISADNVSSALTFYEQPDADHIEALLGLINPRMIHCGSRKDLLVLGNRIAEPSDIAYWLTKENAVDKPVVFYPDHRADRDFVKRVCDSLLRYRQGDLYIAVDKSGRSTYALVEKPLTFELTAE